MPTVFSSNYSSVTLDGDAIEGVQSLAFRVVTEQEDVRAVGSSSRIGVVFGLRTVQGELTVRSASVKLDDKLRDQAVFNLVASLRRDDSANSPKRTLSFQECYVGNKDFSIGANGSVLTTYAFTATALHEE